MHLSRCRASGRLRLRSRSKRLGGAQVRTDSLLERRGFEPPVLFALHVVQGKALVARDFNAVIPKKPQEKFSPTRFIRTAVSKASGFRTVSEEQKTQKGPAVRIPSAPPTSQCEPTETVKLMAQPELRTSVMMPAGSPKANYGDSYYNPLWCALEELGLPVAFHTSATEDPNANISAISTRAGGALAGFTGAASLCRAGTGPGMQVVYSNVN
jgi:hypothetical protein